MPLQTPEAAAAAEALAELAARVTLDPKLDDERFRKDIDKSKEPLRAWLNLLAAWHRSNAGARDALGVNLSDLSYFEQGLHNNPQLMVTSA